MVTPWLSRPLVATVITAPVQFRTPVRSFWHVPTLSDLPENGKIGCQASARRLRRSHCNGDTKTKLVSELLQVIKVPLCIYGLRRLEGTIHVLSHVSRFRRHATERSDRAARQE
jgi:hypothetical protein